MNSVTTHNGIFHADEVTAIALLSIKFDGNIKIIRTRDAAVIDAAVIAVDVGGKYDLEKSRFDHHQSDYIGTLSSAGMVWGAMNHYCGRCDHISEPCGELWCTGDCTGGATSPSTASIDSLIKEVDDQDVGIARNGDNHYCQIISSFNARDIYSAEQDAAFDEAVAFAKRYILSLMVKAQHEFDLQTIVKATKIIVDRDVKIAVVDKDAGFIPANMFKNKADLVIQWDTKQSHWTVQSLDSEEFKLSTTERESETFCHKAGFIGGYKIENYLDGIVICLNGKTTTVLIG
jgi:uncharacterized UPF0160 family protein